MFHQNEGRYRYDNSVVLDHLTPYSSASGHREPVEKSRLVDCSSAILPMRAPYRAFDVLNWNGRSMDLFAVAYGP